MVPPFVSMPMRLEDWQERLRPVLEEEGAELLDAQVHRGRNALKLRFFVDRERGVGLDDLARMSRRIGMALDADPALAGTYELEVSSPGMNRVVRTQEHFRRFAGERVHVWTRLPREGRQHFEGAIVWCDRGVVSIQVDGAGPLQFRLDEIERAELRLDPKRPPQRGRGAEAAASHEVPNHGE